MTMQKFAFWSIPVSIVVLLMKLAAWQLTGSVALMSDALESIVNIVAAIIAYIAIRIANKPPDEKHPFGHRKAEYLSAVAEGVMIVVAALVILQEAVPALIDPRLNETPGLGIAISFVATLVNGAWAFWLLTIARREKSPALEASARHIFTDVITSVGVVAGLALALLTGFLILDPILAIIVALNILWEGWKVIRSSIDGLMDVTLSDEELRTVSNIITSHMGDAMEYHDLKGRRSGNVVFVEFHLVVDGAMPVGAAHDILRCHGKRIDPAVSRVRFPHSSRARFGTEDPMNSDGYFDEEVANSYDNDHGGNDQALIDQTVDFLIDLSQQGEILEFAIGTGRIALPLTSKGARVKGIELSGAMVRKLREKETGSPIAVEIGDMTSTRVAGQFSLVFLVFNTIDNLTTQDAQIACFKNASDHLGPGGRFLVETLVPPIQRLPFGETRLAFASSSDHIGIDEFDIATQTYSSNHVWMENDEHKYQSIPFRYAWPAELDLMARMAGLQLEFRWSDWDRSPFDRMSKKHISVWRKD